MGDDDFKRYTFRQPESQHTRLEEHLEEIPINKSKNDFLIEAVEEKLARDSD